MREKKRNKQKNKTSKPFSRDLLGVADRCGRVRLALGRFDWRKRAGSLLRALSENDPEPLPVRSAVRPSVLSHSQESVGGGTPPLSQGAAPHCTALHRTLRYPPLPAATSSPARNQEMLRSAPSVSVTVRLLLDNLRSSSSRIWLICFSSKLPTSYLY